MKLLLIGAGNMGEAMLHGLQQYDITVVEAYEKRAQEIKERFSGVEVLSQIPNIDGYIVILAIKPITLDTIQFEGQAAGVISILAGIPLQRLKESITSKLYIRAMPNMAALVQQSATSLCGDEALKETAIMILSSIGTCFWLNSEDELDIATGLAGSAPAWVALVAEALSDGAVNLGLKRDISYQYIAQLFQGVGKVLESEHPAILKDKVTSPKGTTIAGIKKLEEGRVRDSFMEAMKAAYERAQGSK